MTYTKVQSSVDDAPKTCTSYLLREVRKPNAVLVPLRVFIALGWLRAAADKFVTPGWFDGSSLAAFLTQQVEAGVVAFPFYDSLIANAFLPHADLLGYVVAIGQLLVGLALLTGTFTRAALLGAIFMNVNFLLAGVPDPSAFYLVIQLALFAANAGAVLGVDAWLSSRSSQHQLPASRTTKRRVLLSALYLTLAALALVAAAAAFPYITDFSLGGSVYDPVVVLIVVLCIVSAYSLLACLRLYATGDSLARQRK